MKVCRAALERFGLGVPSDDRRQQASSSNSTANGAWQQPGSPRQPASPRQPVRQPAPQQQQAQQQAQQQQAQQQAQQPHKEGPQAAIKTFFTSLGKGGASPSSSPQHQQQQQQQQQAQQPAGRPAAVARTAQGQLVAMAAPSSEYAQLAALTAAVLRALAALEQPLFQRHLPELFPPLARLIKCELRPLGQPAPRQRPAP